MRPRLALAFFLLQTCALGCASAASAKENTPAPARAETTPALPGPSVQEEETLSPAEPSVFEFLRKKYDANADGRVTAAEYRRSAEAFGRLDSDGDGAVTPADFAPEWSERPFPPGFVYGEGGPEPGDPAPDFRLSSTGGETIELSSFRGQRPVALVFGSFT